MEKTKYLKLNIPEENEFYSIEAQNENWIKIDEIIGSLNKDEIADLLNKMGDRPVSE